MSKNDSMLANLRSLVESASEGPWTVEMIERAGFFILDEEAREAGSYPISEVRENSDAVFIATAREAVPALLDRIETALAWLSAEPGDPAYRDDPRTVLAEVHGALLGGDEL